MTEQLYASAYKLRGICPAACSRRAIRAWTGSAGSGRSARRAGRAGAADRRGSCGPVCADVARGLVPGPAGRLGGRRRARAAPARAARPRLDRAGQGPPGGVRQEPGTARPEGGPGRQRHPDQSRARRLRRPRRRLLEPDYGLPRPGPAGGAARTGPGRVPGAPEGSTSRPPASRGRCMPTSSRWPMRSRPRGTGGPADPQRTHGQTGPGGARCSAPTRTAGRASGSPRSSSQACGRGTASSTCADDRRPHARLRRGARAQRHDVLGPEPAPGAGPRAATTSPPCSRPPPERSSGRESLAIDPQVRALARLGVGNESALRRRRPAGGAASGSRPEARGAAPGVGDARRVGALPRARPGSTASSTSSATARSGACCCCRAGRRAPRSGCTTTWWPTRARGRRPPAAPPPAAGGVHDLSVLRRAGLGLARPARREPRAAGALCPGATFTYAMNMVSRRVRCNGRARVEWSRPGAPPRRRPAPGTRTFVGHCGRLSSAKNFPRLVSAFAQVHAEEFPATSAR